MNGIRVPLAWALFVLTVLLAALQVVILLRAEAPLLSGETVDDGFPLVTVATVVASAVGLLIVTRYPRHRIGWLFLVGQIGTILGLVSQSYAFVALTEDVGPRSLAQWTMWVSLHLGGAFALTLIALLLLLAPNGRLLSPRWRWAVGIVLVGITVHNGAVLAVDPADLTAEARAPGTSPIVPVMTLVGGVLLVVGLVCAAVSLRRRLKRAAGAERAQLRWIAVAAVALALSLPAGTLATLLFRVPSWAAVLPLMVAYLALPVCTGVAILRWRLYDIDVFVNRSIVLGLLTGFVALGYVAVVVALAEVAHDQAAWPSLLATAVVALAFQPARRRATQLADRLVYGRQAVPYEALAEFNDELRHAGSTTELLPRTAEAVARVFGAEHVRIWIELTGHPPTVAAWPSSEERVGGSDEELVRVVHDGEQLGGIGVTMPRGRALRAAELRLLDDFATQLGAAFRAVQLERDLADRVELLGQRSEALAESRRRLVTAQSEESRRFEHAIADQVLPYVAPLPDRLRRLADEAVGGDWPGQQVDGLIDEANRGLEALRALTRGVFPAQLTRRGLATTLTSHLEGGAAPHTLEVQDGALARFRPEIESAAYFCAVELVRHLDGPVALTLAVEDEALVLTLSSGTRPGLEHDPRHLVDRVEALGGALSIRSGPEGTRCSLRLPLAPVGPAGSSGSAGSADTVSPAVEQLDEPVGAEV